MIVIVAGALCAGLVTILATAFGTDVHEVPFMLAGKPAPPFSIKRLDNNTTVSLSDFKGRPVVLNFWSTWCGPCKMEHPHLEAGAREFQDRVTFLGMVFEDTEENTRRFITETPTSFTQLFDPKSTVAVDYGVSGVPETYFIDAQGTIRGKYVGPINVRTLRARVQELLK